MKMKGSEAVAKILRELRVECVFGQTAFEFTQPFIDSGIKFVALRTELGVPMAATAYARVTGKPGVYVVEDIGSLHTATGLQEANLSATPIVGIVGIFHTYPVGGFWRYPAHAADYGVLHRPITKWTVQEETIERIPQTLRRAFRVATTGRPGPVEVQLPFIHLATSIDFEIRADPEGSRCPGMRIPPNSQSIGEAAKLLVEAQKPVIVAGGGVVRSRASDELRELAELLAIPVATTHSSFGSFPTNHPLSLGVVGEATAKGRGRVANKLIKEADAILLVGSKSNEGTTFAWTLYPPDAKLISINIDPEEIGRNFAGELGIAADAKLALQELIRAVKTKVPRSIIDTPRTKEIRTLMEEWRGEFSSLTNSDAVPIKHPRLFKEIQNFIDKDTILAACAGSAPYWAANYLDLTPDNHFISPRGFTALGQGFPMALGAQVAAPDKRVICVSGDGAFGYNIMEHETAVRLKLPVVHIVLNNGSWGMERTFFPEPAEALQFAPTNFCKIAEALNCYGVRVERPQDIREAIAGALASGRPSIVDVVTDAEESISREIPWLGPEDVAP